MKRRKLKRTLIYHLIISAVVLLLSANTNAQNHKVIIETCQVQYASHEFIHDIHGRSWIVDGEPSPYKTTFAITQDYFIHIVEKEHHHKYPIDTFSEFEIKKGVDMKFNMTHPDGTWYEVEFNALENTLTFYYSGGTLSRMTKFTVDKLKYK